MILEKQKEQKKGQTSQPCTAVDKRAFITVSCQSISALKSSQAELGSAITELAEVHL